MASRKRASSIPAARIVTVRCRSDIPVRVLSRNVPYPPLQGSRIKTHEMRKRELDEMAELLLGC